MVARFSDYEKLRQAKNIAASYNLFIVDKSFVSRGVMKSEYLLYRRAVPVNVKIGARHSVKGIWELLIKVTGFQH